MYVCSEYIPCETVHMKGYSLADDHARCKHDLLHEVINIDCGMSVLIRVCMFRYCSSRYVNITQNTAYTLS